VRREEKKREEGRGEGLMKEERRMRKAGKEGREGKERDGKK